MNYDFKKTMRISLCFFFVFSCSQYKDNSTSDDLFMGGAMSLSQITPKWFAVGEGSDFSSANRLSPVHKFYDVDLNEQRRSQLVRVMVTTPLSSQFLYGVHIASGQFYQKNAFCEADDGLESNSDTLIKAPVSFGILPKVINHLGEAQRIMIFGKNKQLEKYRTDQFFETRIIGAFIEHFCPFGNCANSQRWRSNVILVGIIENNEKFKAIENIYDLRQTQEWKKVENFLLYSRGYNQVFKKRYHAYRIGAIMPKVQAWRYLEEKAKRLKWSDLKQMRKSCQKIYNYLWEKVYQDSAVELKLKSLSRAQQDLLRQSQNFKKGTFFYQRFTASFNKFYDQYGVCTKYISFSEIEKNPQKHWFLTYYTALHLVHKLGYTYNCESNQWFETTKDKQNKKGKFFKNCLSENIDQAFASAPKLLEKRARKKMTSYEYISMSKSFDGRRTRIESWVEKTSVVGKCFIKNDNQQLPFYDAVMWEPKSVLKKSTKENL